MSPQTAGDEQSELERAAATPLAIRLECVGCEFAAMTFPAGEFMPRFHFQTPCPFGKSRPDQECRTCVHRRIIAVGTTESPTAYRYYGQGAIWPLADEPTADQVLRLLGSPLRRPAWKPVTK